MSSTKEKKIKKVKVVKEKKKISLPNLLTLIRIILVVPMLLLMSISILLIYLGTDQAGASYFRLETLPNSGSVLGYKIALTIINLLILAIFIGAMVTDYFDGAIARKRNLVSVFGKVWDPIADKLMVNLTLVYLAVINVLPFWAMALFLLRDIIVDGVRVFLASKGYDVSAGKWGKIKTFILAIGLTITLTVTIGLHYATLNALSHQQMVRYILNIPIYVALVFAILSGIFYVRKAFKAVKLVTTTETVTTTQIKAVEEKQPEQIEKSKKEVNKQ
ncbi:CDP-diacylglycerol--glycerol-3-phosphate 3-phosphatidyltransferase [Mycoplasma sp. 21DD0573]|uniref:CDP-diacylglycerol--glycerol-3-phosphate 3-phosphatidyltransferase n=1 Tax=unclassified Mycoplasma TaxID=2683645 RepID=UPI002B1D7BCE|nr:CDP-diacylglycerol--glycerol-3-phosphate 3-phosphatidyltransferase [Mycoplasma sp. 21DD0573]MEA4276081.1 CDP-diacylglycerol--glycerol-3-phosphate 3-phosphatidyltransferase [Mycoplasma sp. 21DD0573]